MEEIVFREIIFPVVLDTSHSVNSSGPAMSVRVRPLMRSGIENTMQGVSRMTGGKLELTGNREFTHSLGFIQKNSH